MVAEQTGGRVVDVERIITSDCDVLAPSAAARVITRKVVSKLRCSIIAGAANDTLDCPAVDGRVKSGADLPGPGSPTW